MLATFTIVHPANQATVGHANLRLNVQDFRSNRITGWTCDLQDAGRASIALAAAGSAELSSALDTISRLKRQLAERDKEIFELKVRSGLKTLQS